MNNETNATEIFAKRLKELRLCKDLSLKKLASDLGVTAQSLSLYETGQRAINIDLLKRIAEYFSVSSDYLLGLSDAATNDADLKAVCDYTGLSDKAVKQLRYEITWIFHDGSDELSVFKQIRDYLIENSFLELFGLTYYSLFIDSKSWADALKQYDLHKAEYPDELEYKCDVDRYNIIKLSEEFSNEFDMRKPQEQKNDYYKNKQKYFYVKEQVENNGEHNPKEE